MVAPSLENVFPDIYVFVETYSAKNVLMVVLMHGVDNIACGLDRNTGGKSQRNEVHF